MEFLGIGPLELLFVLLIALIVIGPKDMVKTGRTIGRFLRKVVTSPQWQMVNRTSRELRNIPNRLIREAGLEEMQQDLNNLKQATTDIQKTLSESIILPPNRVTTQKPSSPKPVAQDAPARQSVGPGSPTDSPTGNSIGTIPGPNMADQSELSAWINPAGKPDEPTAGTPSTAKSDDLSAWITPPPANQKTRRTD